MEYNVVGFEFCEQQVQDVLRVIETIKPVIGIIKDSYKIIEQLDEIHEEGIEANGKIEAYSKVLGLKPNQTLTKKLQSEIKSLNELVETGLQKHKELTDYQNDIEEDLTEYLKYILSFNWLNVHILAEVISRLPDEDYQASLATMLLFTNEGIDEEERAEIFNYLSDFCEIEELQHVLRLMYFGEEQEALIEYIATTDLLNE